MSGLAQIFPLEVIIVFITSQIYMEYHQSNLNKLCRICGGALSAGGRVSYSTSSGKGILEKVFGISVEHDNPKVHPPKYCHRCHGVIYHATKKEQEHNRVVFQWHAHSGEDCTICIHIQSQLKVGKKKKPLRGRPQKESIRALILHTRKSAPPILGPTSVKCINTQDDLTCPICTEIVQRPIELTTCSSIVCCECLVQWLHITQDVQCPCCYSDHIRTSSTIRSASTLIQNLLGRVEVVCEKCGMSAKLANYNSHTCSVSKPAVCKELPVEAILNKGLDEPLTPIEERLKSNLTRRAISQSSQSLLSIKTGGQVRYTNMYKYITSKDTHTIQPITLVPVPSPRVSSDNASQRTKHRRAISLQVVREVVSGGCSSTQFAEEARTRSTSEREALLEGLQGGMKVVIPASESLALKADLILPWNKMRIVRR